MIQISFSIGRGRGRGRGRRRLSGGVKEESRREGERERGREEKGNLGVGLDRKAQSNQRGGRGFELYVTHTCTHAHTQSVGKLLSASSH